MYGAFTLYGRPFQTVPLTLSYPSFNLEARLLSGASLGLSARRAFTRTSKHVSRVLWSYNPRFSLRIIWFGLFRVRSPLLAESRLISSPLGTEMVHFPRFAP